MKRYIIAIDQSTSATKAILFDEGCKLLGAKRLPISVEEVEKEMANN